MVKRERECEAEIEELRKQLKELGSQQPAKQKSGESPPKESESAATEEVAEGEFSQFREKLEEFAELMQQDLKQIPATTAVAIFALGVLMGRLMSK